MPVTLSILQIASMTLEYIRNLNIEGVTQIRTNSFPLQMQEYLQRELHDLRMEAKSISFFDLELDKALISFEKTVALSNQKRVGNCYELAFLALDYMAIKFPLINAEVYRIVNGDHVFLVIGRNPDSDPSDPLQWGDNAYFCDPWSDKVYPAKDYLIQLQNFKRKDDVNMVEPFNPEVHALEPLGDCNSAYIIQGHADAHLKEIENLYIEMNNDILQAVLDLITDFEKIAARLEIQYGTEDDKYLLIQSRIESFRFIAQDLRNNTRFEDFNLQYRELRTMLEAKLKNNFSDYHNSKDFSDAQIDILNEHRSKNLWGAICRFFEVPTKTTMESLEALQKTHDKITAIDDKKIKKLY